MDLGSIISGLVIIVLCTIPFVLLHKSRKDKKTELFIGLQKIADSFNAQISEYDCGLEFAIGISEDRHHLFFFKRRDKVEIEQYLPLEKVSNCFINIVNKTIKNKNSSNTRIDRLELVFEFKAHNKNSNLVFYNSEEFFQVSTEFQLIKKWEAVVNQIIFSR